MHPSARDNLRVAVRRHVVGDAVLGPRAVADAADLPPGSAPLAVVDIDGTTTGAPGGRATDPLAPLAVDLTVVGAGGGPATPDALADASFDLVIGGWGLATTADPAAWWRHLLRVCRPGGVVVVVAATATPGGTGAPDDPAAAPTDPAWRPGVAGLAALAAGSGVELADHWVDRRGPWRYLVAVVRPGTSATPAATAATTAPHDGVPPHLPAAIEALQNQWPTDTPDDVEHGRGSQYYIDVFARVHAALRPRNYLEIGVSTGQSLRLASCDAVGIDPDPHLDEPAAANHLVVEHTSDDVFALTDIAGRAGPFDLAFIDGMHLVENVVMDFMNTERHCHAASLVMVDDPCPAHPLQAERHRVTRFWTGDVWKILPILGRWRPDLVTLVVDTDPTATLMVMGLDPASTVLWDHYDTIIDDAINDPTPVHDDIVGRVGAIDPADPLLARVLRMLADARHADDPAAAMAHVRAVVAGALPRTVVAS